MKRANFGATGRELHIDQALSNVAIHHRPDGMIADMIMPVVPVPKQSDHYTIFSRADNLRIEDTKRSRGTEANKITRGVSSDTFYCENYALDYPVYLEDRANMDPIYVSKVLNGRVEFITDKLSLDWEKRVADLVFSSSNVGTATAVSTQWDLTGADPIGDVNTLIDNVRNSSGKKPNKLVFGEDAWKHFRRHPDVRDIIFGANNGGGFPSREQVANLFEVEDVMVGEAFYNAGNEGGAEDLQPLWGPNVLAYYVPSNPSMDSPSFAYSFRWTAAGIPNMQVERHPYDPKRKVEDVEVGYYQDEKVTGSEYGGLLLAVDSST